MNENKKNWVLAGTLGLIAAVVYFASVANYAFPGEGAHLMAVWRGLEVETVPKFPLMAVFARLLGGGNLIAPVCGVLSVMAFFWVVLGFVASRVKLSEIKPEKNRIARIAAVTATVVFMLTPAVRSAATHLEPRMFDFTWAILSIAMVFPFLRASRRISWAFPILLGVVSGLGVADSVLMLVLMPGLAALTAVVARRHGKKPYLPVFLLIVSFFAAFLFGLVIFGLGLEEALKSLSDELRLYRVPPGWLFVTSFATIPFVVSLFSSARAFGEKTGFVQWIFHVALSFVSVLAIATPLSPTSLMEPYGILPVVTSAFAAAVAGLLVAYWWANRRKVFALVPGAILALVIVVTAVLNLFSFDGDAGAFADRVARKVIADLGDRRWFVSDGVLDDHLKIAAAEAGKDVKIISLARDLDPDYLERLGELVEHEGVGGSRNGALRLSLSLGVLTFLQDWFAADPSVTKEVAIFGAPDLWYSAGFTPVPEFLFFGGDAKRMPDWSAWKEFDSILAAPKGWGSYHDRKVTNPTDRMRYNLRRHVGFVANNRGVYLQDQKRDDEAFAMYELVLRQIDCDNICSVFNEVGMVGQNHPKAKAKKAELERMLKAAVEDKGRRYLLWRLGTYYGYIRNPDAFVRLGYAWARSGRPGDAMAQIRRAIDLVPSDRKTVLLNMMASLYANENDQRKSRAIYRQVLEKNAKDHDALIGLMRLELLDGNSQKALEYLQRAAESSGEGKRAKIELAMVAMMKNDLARARSLLKGAVDADPKDMQAWSLLAAVVMQQIDGAKDRTNKDALLKELENEIVPAMEKRAASQHDYYLQATKGFLLLRQRAEREQRMAARDAFARAAKARPDIASAQDIVLGLDISLDDKVHAEAQAKDVLRRNRNAPLANYVMGSLALGRGKYADAEAYLRKAATAPQPVPLALNDLAEVLRRNGKLAEAELYARKAVEKAPRLYVAWETLGSVLMDASKGVDEAEACIRKACELSKDKNGKEVDVRMLVSLARVQLRRGDQQRAKITIRKVQARLGELSEFERREFEKMMKGIR